MSTNAEWWDQMYVGICPRCHEEKFIGHGPLCVDCYLNSAAEEADQ